MRSSVRFSIEEASNIEPRIYGNRLGLMCEFDNGLSFDDSVTALMAEGVEFSKFPLAVIIWK